ncbi:MAG: Gldg family protein, partial [Planctomycetota bacterium]
MAVSDAMNAPRRRLVFGFNVLVQSLLALAVVVVLVWLAGRFRVQGDWTGTGRNSLSAGTVKLLKKLPENIRITAVIPEPDKHNELLQKRRRQVQDLLELYGLAGGARLTHVMLDPALEKAATEKMLKRLQELPSYKDEAKPHQEAMANSGELMQSVAALAKQEAEQLQQMIPRGSPLEQHRTLPILAPSFSQLGEVTGQLQEKLRDLIEGEIPKYGQAVKELRDYATSIQTALDDTQRWMTTEGVA